MKTLVQKIEEHKQKVVDLVIEQIKEDINYGDLTVLDEILKQLPIEYLENCLPEEIFKK